MACSFVHRLMPATATGDPVPASASKGIQASRAASARPLTTGKIQRPPNDRAREAPVHMQMHPQITPRRAALSASVCRRSTVRPGAPVPEHAITLPGRANASLIARGTTVP